MSFKDFLYKNRNQLVISFCVSLGVLQFGFSLGWSSPVITKLNDLEQSPLPELVSDNVTTWIASAVYIGQIIGPFLILYLSNAKGRKLCFLIGGLFLSASYLILAIANNVAMLFIGRILTGLGISITLNLCPVYIGEMASTNLRGILLATLGVYLTIGTLIVYAVGPYVSYSAISYLGLALALTYTAGIYFLVPESPLFCAMKGRYKKMIAILNKLNRQDDVDEMISADLPNSNNESSWKDIFTMKSNKRAFTITCPLLIFQQLSGINVVIFFVTTIFEIAGSPLEPHVSSILVGVIKALASMICPIFVEKGGRKVLLLVSSFICCISLVMLGVFFCLSEMESSVVDYILWLPIVLLGLYFIGFELGFGVIPMALLGEMFQPNVRSTASLLINSIACVFGFALSSSFSYMINGMGRHFTFWIFAIICAITFVFTLVMVPETKGKSLFEIQEMLNNGI